MAIYSKKGSLPKDIRGKDIQNTVITSTGIERVHTYKDSAGNARKKSYRYNKMNGVLQGAGKAKPSYVEFNPKTAKVNTPVSVLVSFNQAITATGNTSIAIANTAGGSSGLVGRANNSVYYAGNTLQYNFTPTVAGTYKVAPQTITGTVNYRTHTGSTAAANTAIPNDVVFGNLVVKP